MAKFDFAFLKNMRRNPYMIVFLILLVLLPVTVFAVAAPVQNGTRIMCRYNHVIKDAPTIWVWRWTAGDYKVTTKTTICAKHKRLEALYLQARKAADKKDYKTAKKLLVEIKATDPAFQAGNVAALAAEVDPSGSLNSGTPGTAPGTTPGNGSTPNYSGDLAGLFPDKLSGYTQVNNSPGTLSVSRMYTADAKAHPNVAYLTIQFSRAGSEATVTDYIRRYVKAYYAANAKSLKIKGKDAYFGTDGADLAILAYPVSGVVVELEMSALDGKGQNLYDTLIDLSNIVP